jgi:hypothetical protein
MPTQDATARDAASARSRVPRELRESHVLRSDDGSIKTFDLRCMTARRWNRSGASTRPGWITSHFGPLVIAFRLSG